MISLAAQKRWKIFQMDVKSTFLNGSLEEEIYVEQPTGFVEKRRRREGLQLEKSFLWAQTSTKSMELQN